MKVTETGPALQNTRTEPCVPRRGALRWLSSWKPHHEGEAWCPGHTCVHTHVPHMHVRAHTDAHASVDTHACTCACTRARTHTHVSAHVHTRVHTCSQAKTERLIAAPFKSFDPIPICGNLEDFACGLFGAFRDPEQGGLLVPGSAVAQRAGWSSVCSRHVGLPHGPRTRPVSRPAPRRRAITPRVPQLSVGPTCHAASSPRRLY